MRAASLSVLPALNIRPGTEAVLSKYWWNGEMGKKERNIKDNPRNSNLVLQMHDFPTEIVQVGWGHKRKVMTSPLLDEQDLT